MVRCRRPQRRWGLIVAVLVLQVLLPTVLLFTCWIFAATPAFQSRAVAFCNLRASFTPRLGQMASLARQHRHSWLQSLESPAVRRNAENRERDGTVAGGVGGAVLGGLLLGPFGAVFGAQLGANWGRDRAADEAAIEELGIDADMVSLAQLVATELAEAQANRDRVEGIRADLAARVVQLEDDVQARYDDAMAALEADDEAAARRALESKQSLQRRLDGFRKDLEATEQRCATLQRSMMPLEQRAMEVANLLERARSASGSQRTALAADAAMLSTTPRDPLLEKFEALEREERR